MSQIENCLYLEAFSWHKEMEKTETGVLQRKKFTFDLFDQNILFFFPSCLLRLFNYPWDPMYLATTSNRILGLKLCSWEVNNF